MRDDGTFLKSLLENSAKNSTTAIVTPIAPIREESLIRGAGMHGKDTSQEFMLMYFPLIYQRYIYERELGEKRFNFYLTLVSATIGAILLLTTNQNTTQFSIHGLLIGLTILFIVGILTYERICNRGIACVSWLIRTNMALRYFVQKDSILEAHIRFHQLQELASNRWNTLLLGTGGLVRTMALLNTINAIALTLIITWSTLSFEKGMMTIVATIVGAGVWLLQTFLWHTKINNLKKRQTAVRKGRA